MKRGEIPPSASRNGAKIECIARRHGLMHLELLSSLTAKPFYRALGHEVGESVEHVLRSDEGMAAVKIRKTLRPPTSSDN
jgi:hypothetical protein